MKRTVNRWMALVLVLLLTLQGMLPAYAYANEPSEEKEIRFHTHVNLNQKSYELSYDIFKADGTLVHENVLTAYDDALSANTIAVAELAPVLLTTTHELPPTTDAFLQANDVSSLIVVGGRLAIGDGVVSSLNDLAITRLAGATRYHTALEVAQYQYETPVNVFLATGRNFADALVAGALLTDDGAILLADYDELLPEVRTYMKKAKSVTILGGSLAIKVDLEL